MKKLLVLTLALGLAAPLLASAADAPFKSQPDASQWPSLFDKTLSNADFPKGVWYYTNDVLTATEDQAIWSKTDYENFAIDLEFKNDPAANSGVLFYCSNTKDWIPNAIEAQILDDYAPKWKDASKNWLCGSIFGRQAPSKQTVKPAGEWNHFTMACKGQNIWIWLNGELINEMDLKQFTSKEKNPDGSDAPTWLGGPLSAMKTTGKVGLQGKHSGAAIFFRNVKIKKLE
jgi:hypothetical protein